MKKLSGFLQSSGFLYASVAGALPGLGFALGFYSLFPALILIGAVGVLAYNLAPAPKIVFYAPTTQTFEEYRGFLDRLINKSASYIPSEAKTLLDKIRNNSFEIFKFVESKSNYIGDEEVANLKTLISGHLLECVNSYLALPKLYANTHKVQGNQTHKDIFIEQLDLFNQVVEQMTNSIVNKELPQILSQTQYLQNKLHAYQGKR